MGLKIADLLKWRKSLILKDVNGNPIVDEETGNPVEVWLRVVGDGDLQDSYKIGRALSAKKRKELRDGTSLDYLAAVEPIRTGTREEAIEIIKTARTSNLMSEASVVVPRPDDLKMEEFAIDPDAPTLEEQEKFDAAILEQEQKYVSDLGEYQLARIAVIEAELAAKSLEELREIAEKEVSDVVALTTFLVEMVDYKVSHAVYLDKTCKQRAFDSVEEFKATDNGIRQQLIEAYQDLEAQTEDIKN